MCKQGNIFSELDVRDAYHQASLDDQSKLLTTISKNGFYSRITISHTDLNTEPGAFQRRMHQKLAQLPAAFFQKVMIFVDNIVIVAENETEMLAIIEAILNGFEEEGLKLNIQKCKWFQKEIVVFGFRIDKEGVHMLSDRVKAMLKAPAPDSFTILRSFLGKINYHSEFLKTMTTILAPLYDILKQTTWTWPEQCSAAFNKIKKQLWEAPFLVHYHPEWPVILTCDASPVGLGAVLSHKCADGIERPIAFASKKLDERQQTYHQLDGEGLGIIFGLTKFYRYIFGQNFELRTDNQALAHIFKPQASIPKMAAKRLQNWAIFLKAFNFTIKNIPSNKNCADFLSRAPIDDTADLDDIPKREIENSLLKAIQELQFASIDWKRIQLETRKDETLAVATRFAVDG